jgi:hypothetical protein
VIEFKRNIGKFISGIVAAALLSGVDVHAQTVVPPVIVNAPGNILCSGAACVDLVHQMQMIVFGNLIQTDQMEPVGVEDMVIDHAQFCRNLKDGKPPNCATAPIVPGVNYSPLQYAADYHSEGCHYGNWAGIFTQAISDAGLPGYNGNPDQPLTGVNFQVDCATHRACYASQSGRNACDAQFHDMMLSTCAHASPSGHPSAACGRFAAAYRVAAELDGQGAYTAGSPAHQCAMWHRDMEQNHCPK